MPEDSHSAFLCWNHLEGPPRESPWDDWGPTLFYTATCHNPCYGLWVYRVLLELPGSTLLTKTFPASFSLQIFFFLLFWWSQKATTGSLLNFALTVPGALCRSDHGSAGSAALEVLPRQSCIPVRMWRWGWGRALQPIVFNFGAWAKTPKKGRGLF